MDVSWTIKKAECQRIDAFKLWCWRRLSRVSWTARRSNQSILKEISPEYSVGGLMLNLKLQYSGHLMQRTDSLEKTLCWQRLKAGGEGDDRGWDGWMASLTRWTWIWVNSESWWWTGGPGVQKFTGLQRVRQDWATEPLNWLWCMGLRLMIISCFSLRHMEQKLVTSHPWIWVLIIYHSKHTFQELGERV